MDAIGPVSLPVDPRTGPNALNGLGQVQGRSGAGAVSEEFLTLFYKEMLKQAMKAPSVTFNQDENEDNDNNIFSMMNQDVMIEQFAKELARNQLASPGWLPVQEKAK